MNKLSMPSKIHQKMLSDGFTCTPENVTQALEARWEVLVHNGITNDVLRKALHDVNQEDPKNSLLFARLLEGKKALLFPPPKRRGRNDYELIESNAPTKVNIDFNMSSQQMMIDSEPWRVMQENDAARKIRVLLTSSFSANEFVDALSAKPEWIVAAPRWPAFKVSPGLGTWKVPKGQFCRATFMKPIDSRTAKSGPWGEPVVHKAEGDVLVNANCWVISKTKDWEQFHSVYLEEKWHHA